MFKKRSKSTAVKLGNKLIAKDPQILIQQRVESYQPLLVKLWNLCFLTNFEKHKNDISFDSLLQIAKKRTSISKMDVSDIVDGANIFLDDLRHSQALHPFGCYYARQMVIAMLTHRLKLDEFIKVHPEVLNESIQNPLFVFGLPRSGTTFLYNLLAQDPSHRYMSNWEAFIGQTPPKGRYSHANDPRRKYAKWVQLFQKLLMPDIDKLHVFTADGPEECTPILMQGFASQALAGSFDAPAYSRWLNNVNYHSTYLYHKKVLQTLQWKYHGKRWLLKSPDHIPAVDAVFKTHPDACIIHIHRDPVKSVSSWASLNLCYRGVYYQHVDTHKLGQQVLYRLGNDMDRYLIERQLHSHRRFYDLNYETFLKNPIQEIQKAYDHFGFQLGQKGAEQMQTFLSNNPRHKHGIHRYSPEDFGLSARSIRNRFERYLHEII